MKYSELILLGFKRRDYEDSVHFNEFGFEPFELTKKLGKKHSLHWDVTELNKVRLNKLRTDGYTIEKKWDIFDLETVARLIEMFG